jgi:hypothetical protein
LDQSQPGSNMSPSDQSNGAIDLSIRGRKRKSYRFLILAVGLFVFAAIAATCFCHLAADHLANCRWAVGK